MGNVGGEHGRGEIDEMSVGIGTKFCADYYDDREWR